MRGGGGGNRSPKKISPARRSPTQHFDALRRRREQKNPSYVDEEEEEDYREEDFREEEEDYRETDYREEEEDYREEEEDYREEEERVHESPHVVRRGREEGERRGRSMRRTERGRQGREPPKSSSNHRESRSRQSVSSMEDDISDVRGAVEEVSTRSALRSSMDGPDLFDRLGVGRNGKQQPLLSISSDQLMDAQEYRRMRKLEKCVFVFVLCLLFLSCSSVDFSLSCFFFFKFFSSGHSLLFLSSIPVPLDHFFVAHFLQERARAATKEYRSKMEIKKRGKNET